MTNFTNTRSCSIIARIVTLALCAVMLISAAVPAFGAEVKDCCDGIVPGDANLDGKITMKDASAILKYCVSLETKIDLDNADVRNDDTVNSRDASLLLKFIADWDVRLGHDDKYGKCLVCKGKSDSFDGIAAVSQWVADNGEVVDEEFFPDYYTLTLVEDINEDLTEGTTAGLTYDGELGNFSYYYSDIFEMSITACSFDYLAAYDDGEIMTEEECLLTYSEMIFVPDANDPEMLSEMKFLTIYANVAEDGTITIVGGDLETMSEESEDYTELSAEEAAAYIPQMTEYAEKMIPLLDAALAEDCSLTAADMGLTTNIG